MAILKKNYNEIINDNPSYNFNKDLLQIINDKDNNKYDYFTNYIFYGPSCSYKYKNVLKLLQHFSPSNLKYERKLHINLSKNEFYIKISDIHYEIDIENFIYNSKCLWNEIFVTIYNSITSSNIKKGYIVFRNFDKINYDLLELLYSYMQKELFPIINIKFIIITECVTFIPLKITNICKILYFGRLNKKNINAISSNKNKTFFKNFQNKKRDNNLNTIINKVNNPNIFTYLDISNNIDYIEQYKSICDTYINLLLSKKYDIKNIRTVLYDILIYNLNSHECFFYIIKNIIEKDLISINKIGNLLLHSTIFLKNYNNNYRPIFHLETYTLYLIELIHENN